MTWIRTIPPEEADEKLAAVYERVVSSRGKLSNIMKVQSLHPGAMAAHLDLYMTIMFDRSGLSRQERELVATVVSIINNCSYCVEHHATALNAYWRDDKRIEALVENWMVLSLSERENALLTYAVALTETPENVTEEHIQALRNQGLTDEDVLTLNLIVSYFNFVNRIALGLGVDTSPSELSGYIY